jgi:o-succinylbenzoate---CoA ligase
LVALSLALLTKKMAKPLVVVPANDTVKALQLMIDVLSSKKAIFVCPPSVNGVMPDFEPAPDFVDDNIACIVESSGSTGVPKRISISREALTHAAIAGQERLGPAGQWLLALPINFIAGQQVLLRSVLADTQPVIMNTSLPFTTEAFFRSANLMTQTNKYTSLVPAQLAKLVVACEKDQALLDVVRGFRAILVGGQATAFELQQRALELGIKVVISYGMTETSGGCVYDGIPLEGVRLKIAPDGRLLIQGKTLAEGQDDWIFTNDLAELTDSGKLIILGRADRVIISGGLKVSLDRVEYLGSDLAGVEEISAVSISDETWGERVGICYVGSPEVADDIANQLAELLGPAGKPIRVIRVDKLPKLATSKPDILSIKSLFQQESN